MKQPHSRHVRLLDAAAVLVLVAGWSYLAVGSPVSQWRRPVSRLPELRVRQEAGGRSFVDMDMAGLNTAFRRAGLPDPPDLNSADPVPVDIVLRLAQAWIDTGRVTALGQLGRVYQAIENHEAALRCFAAAAGLDPDDARWWYGLGAECQAMGLSGPAIEALEHAGRLDQEYPTTYARLGELYLEAGELDKAEASYEQYRNRQPDISLAYVGLGRVALARGRPAEAERLLRTAVEKTPNDFLAHRLLGRALATNGNDELSRRHQTMSERLPHYSGWLVFDPRLSESHELANTQRYLTNQLRLALSAGDYAAAARVAERLVKRRPGDHATIGNLASIYRRLDRLDDARELVNRGLALAPDSAALYCTRAEIAIGRKDYATAHRALDEAQARDPQLARVLDLRGRILFIQGQHDEAIAAVTRALELDPMAFGSHLLLAHLLRTAGRTGEAVRTLEALLELDPANPQARQMLDALTPG
jgi:tetratricopeptide (TPR) repeat protein